MHELWDRIEQIPINNQTILLGAAGAALVTLLLFVGLRVLWHDWFDPGEQPIVEPAAGTLLQKFRLGRPQSFSERFDSGVEHLVASTGLELSAEQAAGWVVLVAVACAAGLYLIRPEWWMGLFGLVLGTAASIGVFLYYRSLHRWKIREQMPEIFMMLAQSSRAGLSLDRSIEMIGQQSKIAVAAEFRRCSTQIELGLSVVAALQSVADRLRLLDFNALVSLVALHQQAGGNLALQLERLANSTRDHNQFASYLRTATALGRTTSLAIGLATPLILLAYAIFPPEYALHFYETQQAWTLIAIALGLELIGALWLYHLLNIDY